MCSAPGTVNLIAKRSGVTQMKHQAGINGIDGFRCGENSARLPTRATLPTSRVVSR